MTEKKKTAPWDNSMGIFFCGILFQDGLHAADTGG